MKLLEKGKIGKMVLRNRVFMCPMGTPSEVDRGIPERAINYFVERAKGGTGLIITGGCQATTKFEEAANYQLDSFRYVDRLNFLAEQAASNMQKMVYPAK